MEVLSVRAVFEADEPFDSRKCLFLTAFDQFLHEGTIGYIEDESAGGQSEEGGDLQDCV